jgi:L-rhamnonate dehydratase
LRHNVVDILQPDINWCGGLSTCLKIAAAADAAGKKVVLHGGGRNPFGQHFTHAIACAPWLEYYIATAPGVPLSEATGIPGNVFAEDGWLVPSDAPGFGLGIPEEWIESYF